MTSTSTTTSTSTEQRGLRITPDGDVAEITVTDGDGIRAAIGCHSFDVISLEDRIDLWVDDEGLLVVQPQLNFAATVLAHALGARTAVFGTAVVLSVDLSTGETRGLSGAQLDRVRVALKRPGRETRVGVAQTIGVLIAPARG